VPLLLMLSLASEPGTAISQQFQKLHFKNNSVQFININVLEFDAFKHGAGSVDRRCKGNSERIDIAFERLQSAVGVQADGHKSLTSNGTVRFLQPTGPSQVRSVFTQGESDRSSQYRQCGLRIWSSARRVVCQGIYTNYGERVIRKDLIWNMDIPVWL